MRLLITTDTVGGVWTFTSALSEELVRRGHTVHLVSFGRQPSRAQSAWADQQREIRARDLSQPSPKRHPERREGSPYSAGNATAADQHAPEYPQFTYTPTAIPLEWTQNNDQALEAGQALLLQELQQRPADLILSNQFCFGRLNTPIPRVVVAHSDVLSWAHTCRPSALEPTSWLNRYTSMVQAGLLDAAAVIAPTTFMGKALVANFFLPRHFVVIPNGASVERSSESVPGRKLQAITAGRLWDEAKGLDTLNDLVSPIPLLIAGDNSFESPEPQTSWPEHLVHLGPLSRPDLHQRFRQSAIYVCPSRYEPFGLAPLEAALCGCALVLRDLPSLREIWADSALYFTDTLSLTSTLQSLVDDPGLLAEAQTRAQRRAAHFTPERMTDSYLHLFRSILQPQDLSHVA